MSRRRHGGISRCVRPDRFSAGEAGEPLRASCCLTLGINLSLNQAHRIHCRESGRLPAGAPSRTGTRWTGRGADGAPRIVGPRGRPAPGPAGQGDPGRRPAAPRERHRSGPRRLLRSDRTGRTNPRRGTPQSRPPPHRRGTGRGNPATGRQRSGPPATGPGRHGHGSGIAVRDQCWRGPRRTRQAGSSFAARRGCRSARPHRSGIRWSAPPDRRPRRSAGDPIRRRTWPPTRSGNRRSGG